MSTVILLGAGASVEAGVPDTRSMTTKIRDVLEKSHRQTFADVISFVAGGLMFRAGMTGGDPFSGVDVEEVLNAISLLAERDQLEASPFIAAWHPRVDELDSEAAEARSEVSRVESALSQLLGHVQENARQDRHFWAHQPRTNDFARAFKDAVWAIARGRSRGAIFRATEEAMISALRKIVWVDVPDRVAYLAPLFRVSSNGRLCIATLNYDNTIELAAKSSDVHISSGIEAWSQHGTFDSGNDAIFLLKLHGSIDWVIREQPVSPERPMLRHTVARSTSKEMEGGWSRPAIVFGGRGKLTTDGPFLDLLRAFAEEVRRATALVVIGYSFRDPHVNEYIARWINDGADRRIVVVDPAFEGSRVSFARELLGWRRKRLDLMPIGASEAIPQLIDRLAHTS